MKLPPELTAAVLKLAGELVGPASSKPASNKPRKYRNVPTVIDGTRYDSAKEARHGQLLQAMLRDGLIADLRRQVTYDLHVNGWLVCRYKADFVFTDCTKNVEVVQDVKGYQTAEYKLKKKLMFAVHGIEIMEV